MDKDFDNDDNPYVKYKLYSFSNLDDDDYSKEPI